MSSTNKSCQPKKTKCGKLLKKIVKKLGKLSKKQCDCDGLIVLTQKDFGPSGYMAFKPGVYRLCENVNWAPNTPNSVAMTITSSDVVFDLNGFTLKQTIQQSNNAAISVNNSSSSVFILNGEIRNFSQFGIVLNAGSYSIGIQNVDILETGLTNGMVTTTESIALLGNGTSLTPSNPSNPLSAVVSDVVVRDCQFCFGQSMATTSITLPTALAGSLFQFSQNILFQNCQANHLSGPANTGKIGGILTYTCQNVEFENCESAFVRGLTSVYGFANLANTPIPLSTLGFRITNCTTRFITSDGKSAEGFSCQGVEDARISGLVSSNVTYDGAATTKGFGAIGCCCINSKDVLIEKFYTSNINSSGDAAHGLHTINCVNVTVRDSDATNVINTYAEASGFTTVRNDRTASDLSTNITFDHCTATNIQGGPTSAGLVAFGGAGFRLGGNISNIYVQNNCIATNCTGAAGGWGIYVFDAFTKFATNVSVRQAQCDSNSSYGIQDTSVAGSAGPIVSTSNTYINNKAQNNATANYSVPNLTGSNMLVSYSALLATTNVNPFANIGVPNAP